MRVQQRRLGSDIIKSVFKIHVLIIVVVVVSRFAGRMMGFQSSENTDEVLTLMQRLRDR